MHQFILSSVACKVEASYTALSVTVCLNQRSPGADHLEIPSLTLTALIQRSQKWFSPLVSMCVRSAAWLSMLTLNTVEVELKSVWREEFSFLNRNISKSETSTYYQSMWSINQSETSIINACGVSTNQKLVFTWVALMLVSRLPGTYWCCCWE